MMWSFLALSLLMLAVAALFIVLPLRRLAVSQGDHARRPWHWPAIWLVTLLSVTSAGLYGMLGEPAVLLGDQPEALARTSPGSHDASNGDAGSEGEVAPSTSSAGDKQEVTQAQIEGMVERLAQRLQKQPDDPAGWRMLAKSYETLRRFDDAVHAYQSYLKLQAPDADVLTEYAVTLGMSRGQTLAGEPEVIINQALKLDPRHIQALALSGSAAFEQRDYARAVGQWQKLLALIPPDADMRASIERNVEKAKALAAG